MKRNFLIVCLSVALLSGCSNSMASKFGETLCDCANKAKGDRNVYQECADKVIHSSEDYQKVLKNANREEYMNWRKKTLQGMSDCLDELRAMGVILDTNQVR